MIGFYNYTVIATYLGLTSGIFGIFFAFSGFPLLSVYCLMLCGVMDMFDGRIARRRDRSTVEKRFGIQIDSLSDLICFGVLPACIGYAIGMRHAAFVPIMVVYVLAALIRLAYYNVSEEERQQQTSKKRLSYEGLPVTSTALILPLVYLLRNLTAVWFHWLYAAALLLISVAFLWKFRLPKPGMKGMAFMLGWGILETVLLVIWGK